MKRTSVSVLVTVILAGIIGFRLGSFAGCSSPWLPQTIGDNISPSYSHNYNNAAPRRAHTSPSSRRHSEQATGSGLPYKCGVVFFYHIPSTGGASINTWLRKYAHPKKGFGFSYFQKWEADFKGKKSKNITIVTNRTEAAFAQGMNQHIQNMGKDEWRIAHGHINSMHINETEYLLTEWRSTVEAQGCHMINTVMLRDPLSHTISLHKVIGGKNSTWEEWTRFLNKPVGRGLWATNLDFVLYNKGRRNEYNVSKEEKVQRAMDILDRHFDVVTVGNHNLFMNLVLNMTGWDYIEMPYTNSFKGELTFTKKRVESLMKVLRTNGDLDFMDAVRQRYHGYLSYLN